MKTGLPAASPQPDLRQQIALQLRGQIKVSLQRIALSYLFAGLVFCCFGLRGRIVAFVAILLGYWALATFVPVRSVGSTRRSVL